MNEKFLQNFLLGRSLELDSNNIVSLIMYDNGNDT